MARNNLRSSRTVAAHAIRNAKITLVTVNRDDSLTQLVNAHAIKTNPAAIHSYDKLIRFKLILMVNKNYIRAGVNIGDLY